jgi:hypothetical protein
MFIDATVMQYTLTDLLGSDLCSIFADVVFYKYVSRLQLGNVKCGVRETSGGICN